MLSKNSLNSTKIARNSLFMMDHHLRQACLIMAILQLELLK